MSVLADAQADGAEIDLTADDDSRLPLSFSFARSLPRCPSRYFLSRLFARAVTVVCDLPLSRNITPGFALPVPIMGSTYPFPFPGEFAPKVEWKKLTAEEKTLYDERVLVSRSNLSPTGLPV